MTTWKVFFVLTNEFVFYTCDPIYTFHQYTVVFQQYVCAVGHGYLRYGAYFVMRHVQRVRVFHMWNLAWVVWRTLPPYRGFRATSQYKDYISWYSDSHYKDETILRPSYLCVENLYWKDDIFMLSRVPERLPGNNSSFLKIVATTVLILQ